jgi:hypothetical protein
MTRISAILAMFLLGGVSCVWAQQSKPDAVQQAKTAQAGRAATRFLRRFNETRDFGVVYREFFVRDPKLRLAVARKYYLENPIDEKLAETLDDATVENIYQAFLSTAYLGFFYMLNQKDYNNETEVMLLASLWLHTLSQTLPQMKEKQVIKAVIRSFEFCDDEKDYLLTTKQQIDEWLLFNRRFAAEVQRRMPPRPASTKLYRKNVTDIVFNGRPTYVEDGDEQLGIPKGTLNYTISRGVFRLIWIEENGQFRVVAPILGD